MIILVTLFIIASFYFVHCATRYVSMEIGGTKSLWGLTGDNGGWWGENLELHVCSCEHCDDGYNH